MTTVCYLTQVGGIICNAVIASEELLLNTGHVIYCDIINSDDLTSELCYNFGILMLLSKTTHIWK